MSSNPDRLLLASIHDVSPRFENEVEQLVDLLAPHVGSRLAMLVVPNHWGDAPLIPGSGFATRLRSWAENGIEIFLHGFSHRDQARHSGPTDRMRARFMTAGEGEFLGLSCSEAEERIANGRALVESITGRPIHGFIAPAWLYGGGTHEALERLAIPIAEDHLRVWSPRTGAELAWGPVITWASRTRARLYSSLAAAAALRHAPLGVVRIGVHPPDVRHPQLVNSINATFRSARRSRRPAAYADLPISR